MTTYLFMQAKPCHVLVIAILVAASTLNARTAAAQERMYFPAVENVTSVLVQKINAEKVRIDMSAWYFTDRSIVTALVNRFNAGVPVRLIGDRASIFEVDPNTKSQFYYLANAGIPIRLRYNPRYYPEVAHWKAIIFVGQRLVSFGSANFTPFELAPVSTTNYKDETVLLTNDLVLVNAFKTQFDRMWNDTTVESRSRYPGPPYFRDWNSACSAEPACADYKTRYPTPKPMIINRARLEPDHPMPPEMVWGQGAVFNNRLITEINAESRFIDFVVYRITVSNIPNALIAKHASGVPVRIIMDPQEYRNRKWPEFWLTRAYIDKMWAAGIPIKKRIHAGLTHMKMLITSNYATNASSNHGSEWQRDHNYFVPAIAKPAVYDAMVNRFNIMWNDTAGFANFVPEPPDAPVLDRPASGAVNVSRTAPLVWKRAPFAVSYDVYLGTSSSSLQRVANVPARLVNNPPTTYSWTPPAALLPQRVYYWRVVSRTNASLTARSVVRSFTTAP
jgi:phosphatidylserine/phosphatidylglycerophosphate/cardiolipin synthase-like enzyme